MSRSSPRRSSKLGLPPGTLVHIGEPGTGPVPLAVIDFAAERVEEGTLADPKEVLAYLKSDSVTWLDISGVHDVEVVARIGSALGIHPLVLEDVVNTRQRPKAEIHEEFLFVVVKMIRYREGEVDTEQVSIVLGRNYVITFQEKPGDVFDSVRERIRLGKGRIRKFGADYLAYALLDLVVDHYFVVLEGLGEEIEELEDELIDDPEPDTLQAIHELKRQMLTLRKAAWPLRELVATLERSETELVAPATMPYLRDVYDHAVQVIDSVESFREILSSYLDIYLSSVSNRMNEVMKVLTVMATVFIPLTFLVGVYGMNFEYMPELRWRWAYPVLWGIMGGIAGGMVWVFKRKKWF